MKRLYPYIYSLNINIVKKNKMLVYIWVNKNSKKCLTLPKKRAGNRKNSNKK
jgi:hypothetical protein